MITVTYNDDMCGISITGHGGGVKGSDIVCAGVSTLAYAYGHLVEMYTVTGSLRGTTIISNDDVLEVTPGEAYSGTTMSVIIGGYKTVMSGFMALAEAYPNKVKLLPHGTFGGVATIV